MQFYRILLIAMLTLLIVFMALMGVVVSAKAETELQFGAELYERQLEYQKVYTLGKAISRCEGYYAGNTLAWRRNNPGNLSGDFGVIYYDTALRGWNELHSILLRKAVGQTPKQINSWYAEDPNWFKCVDSLL